MDGDVSVQDRRRAMGRPGVDTPATQAAWDALREQVVVTVRPVASPSSIGLFGLAAGAFTLSGLQLEWVPVEQGHQVALVLIGFAFVAQALASIFAFISRDVTVATAMGVLALTWLVTGLVMYTSPAGSTSKVLGLFLLCSGVMMVLTGFTAALGKLLPATIFVLAGVRFALAGAYHLSADDAWQTASGILGLILATLAVYGAWAFEIEGALKKTVLPVGRRRQGAVAVHGSLLEQVKDIAVEPGVRSQL